jgi:hypothetical protein
MVTTDFLALEVDEEFLLARLRIHSSLTKLDWHVIRVQQYLIVNWTSYELQGEHLFVVRTAHL